MLTVFEPTTHARYATGRELNCRITSSDATKLYMSVILANTTE